MGRLRRSRSVRCRTVRLFLSSTGNKSKEVPLPHSARAIAFYNHETACFAYSRTDYALFSIPNLTATEITTPATVTSSVSGMGALTGLTGYMTLGLGSKPKPGVVTISDSEVLITKDSQSKVLACIHVSHLVLRR